MAGVATTGGTLGLAPGCTYTLTSAQTDQDRLAPISGNVTISGNNATITRSSGADFRILHVISGGNHALFGGGLATFGTFTATGITARDNTAQAEGGGVELDGTATLANSFITDNTVTNAGDGGGGSTPARTP
ncbi:hypothetical protein [Streptomyces sp. NPDC048636]|uniref:hypothetical protein n=1 Tax=Streptomyces sp. NPDC048636 TaxID=3155762 RepID=UPI0034320BC9